MRKREPRTPSDERRDHWAEFRTFRRGLRLAIRKRRLTFEEIKILVDELKNMGN